MAGEIAIDTAAIPTMQELTPAARGELTAAIAGEMEEPLRGVTEGDEVVMEFHDLIVRANRQAA